MKYTSKLGTVIRIPDGLTPRQIAAIKADADAGYGTRAQATADRLRSEMQAKGLDPQTGKPIATSTAGSSTTTTAKTATTATAPNPTDIANKQARLDYLQTTRPNDPQIEKLQANIAEAQAQIPTGGGLTTGGGAGSGGAGAGAGGAPLPDPNLPKQQNPDIPLGDAVGKKGVINPDKAEVIIEDQVGEDVGNQFKLDHPMKMTDQYGNVRIIKRDPVTGEVTIQDELGGTAKTFKDLATAAAQTFNGDVSRQKAEEATYGTLTKYYDRDQERELEAAKQEMANRGIPYDPAAAQDPNSNNLYGRTIGGVGEKYRAFKDDAARQAVIAGNQAYATDSAARDSFLQAVTNGATQFSGNWQPYTNTIDTTLADRKMDLLKLTADAFMTKYGIDQDTYIKEKAIAKQGGGGGGGGGGGQPAAGFEIVS